MFQAPSAIMCVNKKWLGSLPDKREKKWVISFVFVCILAVYIACKFESFYLCVGGVLK